MKRIFSFCILLAGMLSFIGLATEQATALKLMTYNVRNCRGMDTSAINTNRISNIIRRATPDIVAIQELDNRTQRSGRRNILQELGNSTGMVYTYAKAINFQGGEYGIGLLSKQRPINIKRRALPGREEARVLLMAEFPDFFFFATHLSLTEADQRSSLQIIADEASRCKKPVFLAGDFNFKPQSSPGNQLTQSFTILNRRDQPTCPANNARDLIDYICLYHKKGATCNVEKTEVLPERQASDHRPVVVHVVLPTPTK